MIYVDASVALAQLFAEDRRPPDAIWSERLTSSRLLRYEVWNRVHSRRLEPAHGDRVRGLLDAIAFGTREQADRATRRVRAVHRRVRGELAEPAGRFPAGTRLWKEFSVDGRPVETRVITRDAEGRWAYASYVWQGDDAVRAPAGGLTQTPTPRASANSLMEAPRAAGVLPSRNPS